MDLAATVVAKVGQEIVRVECKTCRKERAYKPPKGVQDPSAAPKAKRKTKSASAEEVSAKSAAAARAVAVEWQNVMTSSKASKRIKYSPKCMLEAGNIVDHAKFGDGVVLKLHHPNKAEVIFQDDIRLLIYSL